MTHIANANILDQLRVNLHLGLDLLENLEHDAIEGRVLETAFLALAQGRPGGEGNDNVIGVLLRAKTSSDVRNGATGESNAEGDSHLRQTTPRRSHVGDDALQSFGGHDD